MASAARVPTRLWPRRDSAHRSGCSAPSATKTVATGAGAAARLVASVRLLGAVGDDDDGRRAVRSLEALGVDCSRVRVSHTAGTGRVVGTVSADGSKRTSAMGGANLRLSPAHVSAFEAEIVGSDVVIVQLEPPADVVRAVLD